MKIFLLLNKKISKIKKSIKKNSLKYQKTNNMIKNFYNKIFSNFEK